MKTPLFQCRVIDRDVSRYHHQWIVTVVTPSNSFFNPSKPPSNTAKELQIFSPKISQNLAALKTSSEFLFILVGLDHYTARYTAVYPVHVTPRRIQKFSKTECTWATVHACVFLTLVVYLPGIPLVRFLSYTFMYCSSAHALVWDALCYHSNVHGSVFSFHCRVPLARTWSRGLWVIHMVLKWLLLQRCTRPYTLAMYLIIC